MSLFMFGVFTDDANYPFSFNNLALVTDFLDRSSHFHECIILPLGAVDTFRLALEGRISFPILYPCMVRYHIHLRRLMPVSISDIGT